MILLHEYINNFSTFCIDTLYRKRLKFAKVQKFGSSNYSP